MHFHASWHEYEILACFVDFWQKLPQYRGGESEIYINTFPAKKGPFKDMNDKGFNGNDMYSKTCKEMGKCIWREN